MIAGDFPLILLPNLLPLLEVAITLSAIPVKNVLITAAPTHNQSLRQTRSYDFGFHAIEVLVGEATAGLLMENRDAACIGIKAC
jgi:hypothetical protein